jgi:hypothetical protein
MCGRAQVASRFSGSPSKPYVDDDAGDEKASCPSPSSGKASSNKVNETQTLTQGLCGGDGRETRVEGSRGERETPALVAGSKQGAQTEG